MAAFLWTFLKVICYLSLQCYISDFCRYSTISMQWQKALYYCFWTTETDYSCLTDVSDWEREKLWQKGHVFEFLWSFLCICPYALHLSLIQFSYNFLLSCKHYIFSRDYFHNYCCIYSI